jgi:hypothetical protein
MGGNMFESGVETEKIVEFLQKKLRGGQIKKKLTVIDPYGLSPGGHWGTQKVISQVLLPFQKEVKLLEVVVSEKHYNEKHHQTLAQCMLPLKLNVYTESKFHDRFWVIDEMKAFVVGASINGFGKKHFFIQDDFLSEKDTETILRLYRSASYVRIESSQT